MTTATNLPKVSAVAAIALSLMIGTQGAFLIWLGLADASDDDYLLGVASAAFGVQTAALIWLALRHGRAVPTPVVALLPAAVIAWTIVLLPNDNGGVGATNLVLGLLLAAAVLLANPVLRGSPAHGGRS